MASQPFTIQSPEEIAKDYGGNKQKIAEAMQMGIVDPTAGTLAGMFIDRMRSAAQTEATPQQTVAQQVFAPPAPTAPGLGAPPAPPQPPMGAPAGLGATPEAAAMAPQMAQEMGAPQEMPSMAEGGMVPPYASGGGLSELPIPDTMFDEPGNGGFDDGYAGGGMVAFADGGSTGDFIERTALSMFPNLRVAGRGRTPARNAAVDGVANSYHLIDAARDLTTPPGMTKAEFIAQLKDTFGADYDILPSKGNSVHIEPGPALGRKVRGGKELAGAAQKPNTLYGMPVDLQGNFDLINSMMPAESEEDIEYRKELTESLSPENRAQAKKDAFFEGLGKLGARLGSAKDKSLLGGLAETLGAGAGDIAESLDEDKKRIREMQRERSQLANATRKEKIEALQMGVNLNAKAADLAEGIETRKADVAYKNAVLAIQSAQLENELLKIMTEGQGKQNTKEQFIQTFYDQFIEKGYSPTLARQYAYISAAEAIAKVKGTSEGLFGEEETGGTTGQKSVDQYDYSTMK
jgi:hypothetical protein